MIPYQLQLKNFLSYGPEPQTIDFTHHHLICLSGKNGHGKSALLDAITWAIWGQARKTSGNSKADQGILHLGQNHMFVILEFEVNNQRYRVRREYVQTKSKPFTSLDFGIVQEDKKVASLTDKTIRSTQDKIEKTIGITYDSFVNSAFLRQGQSNEFSKKSPKERKEILAEILHLQQFEDQKKIAVMQSKKLQQEHNTLCSIQQRIEQELEELSNLSEQIQIIKDKLQICQKSKHSLEKLENNIQSQKEIITRNIKEYELLIKQQKETTQNLTITKKNIQQISLAWHSQHNKSKSKVSKKELLLKQKETQQRLQNIQKKLHTKLELKEQYITIKENLTAVSRDEEQKITQRDHSLQVELTKLKEQYKQVQQQINVENTKLVKIKEEITTFKKEILKTTSIATKNKNALHTYQENEKTFEKIKQQYQKTCAKGSLLQEQLLDIKKNITNHANNKVCSLCQQNLSQNSYNHVQQTLTDKEKNISQELDILKQEAVTLKNKLQQLHTNLKQTKHQYEESINLDSKHTEQNKALSKLETQKAELLTEITHLKDKEKDTKKNITDLEKIITDNKKNVSVKSQKYLTLEKKLTALQNEAKNLQYNPQEHKNIENELVSINEQLDFFNQTEEIATQQAERKAELFNLFKAAQQYTDILLSLKHQIDQYHDLDKKLLNIQREEQEIHTKWNSFDKEQTTLLVEKGSLETKEIKQKELQKELITLNKKIKIIHQEMTDYQEIAKALGKDGIQALLIEQAIPEIEDQTNEVLARLTNNQTQIFIESLRDLKKGGSKETLDIKISDSFGLRDYELFSGGEAFRIDFALRIGISKLLARKAGTTLQTIFIDEGFGSQDEEGLQLIMDNIYKIQDDFAKVIIVSHLPEMKEQFPVQFIVEKKRSGSSVTIIEQG